MDTPYADIPAIDSAMRYLGVRYARDRLHARRATARYDADVARRLRWLAARGIRFSLIAGDPAGRSGTLRDLLATAAGPLHEVADHLEGPNEWDLRGGEAWAQRLREYHAALYGRASSQLGLPVLAPSLGRLDSARELGRSPAHVANAHAYPAGAPPEHGSLQRGLASARSVAPGRPAMITETGYHDARWQLGRQPPVSEAAAAVYLPRLLLESFRLGVRRTYLYELVDEGGDRLGLNQERHFGLFEGNWRPKPAARALRNLLRSVGGGAARPDRSPDALSWRLRGAGDNVHHVLLSRRDGRLALALWRTVAVWDPGRRRAVEPAPVKVAVDPVPALRRARLFHPVRSERPTDILLRPDRVDVALAGDPVVVELELVAMPRR